MKRVTTLEDIEVTDLLTREPRTAAGIYLLGLLERAAAGSQDTSFPMALEDILDIEQEASSLDAAWAAAEAALPSGWVIESIGGGGSEFGWIADAALDGSVSLGEFAQGFGPTPTEALLSLARALRDAAS